MSGALSVASGMTVTAGGLVTAAGSTVTGTVTVTSGDADLVSGTLAVTSSLTTTSALDVSTSTASFSGDLISLRSTVTGGNGLMLGIGAGVTCQVRSVDVLFASQRAASYHCVESAFCRWRLTAV